LVSFKEVLISLISFMGTPNFMKYCAGTILPSPLNHRLSWNPWVTVVLSQCTPIFSPVSDECKISHQYLIFYVKTHTDDPQLFHLHTDLTFRGGYLITFGIMLIPLISDDNYTHFFHPSCELVK
jgi:hypothetical protein